MSMQNLVPSQSEVTANHAGSPKCDGPVSSRFICVSESSCRLADQVEIVGRHLRFATIEGEAGVGKQTLAQLLYRRSTAANPSLARSGFNRSDAREWLLSESDPQSLAGFTYLDRVDLLSAPGQALMLRILKNLDARPAGATVLTASSESSLRDLAAKGTFLADLAFRLTAVRFTIPPLRERQEDIVPLANVFLDRIQHRYRLPRITLAPGAISRLLEHDWPGNVRELSSVLESAFLECIDGVIREEDLSIHPASAPARNPLAPPHLLNLDDVIHNHLCHVLELNRGNKLRTARQLGISRSTLYRLLQSGNSLPPEDRIR